MHSEVCVRKYCEALQKAKMLIWQRFEQPVGPSQQHHAPSSDADVLVVMLLPQNVQHACLACSRRA